MALRTRNILSLCAGVGGLELGISLALRLRGEQSRGILYVEREAAAAASLVASMEAGWLHPAPVWSDLLTFDARPWRGLVHILASGDPCQDNSVAGKREGEDGERFLAPEVVRIAKECRPDLIFRENVPGNADGQLAAIAPPLEGLGYRLAAGIFSSAETGNTMRRERLFIMASPMAGSAGTEEYNAAGNSDFSRKAMEQAEALLRWAAPTASDTNGPGAHGDGGTDLRTQVSQWEAPSVAVTDGSRMTRGGDRSNELLLTGQAMEASKLWAGPAAQNHKGSSEGSITRQDGKSREDILSYQAEQFFRPPSSPDRPIAGGSMSSTDSPNSNQHSAKRKLNPIFVEALMRWPTGLSGFERQATAWTRWQQLMPSFLLMLCSQQQEQKQPDLFGGML
ncbi:DNA cytosine methyltransferase [Novosphingobium sp. ES2-1]|uniref:DNA cytosine methyltransferase n=1 Tax=Novosphingobium sp. ES2-1 TaxID=2780074 RepID=UPI00187ED052|nr:DNA cytosine methyltransferase [Novosphingobium sp. ES2-1]QOV95237.1 DNA cytosine methyltransferase [Novosphingobium sp. ES2-1]